LPRRSPLPPFEAPPLEFFRNRLPGFEGRGFFFFFFWLFCLNDGLLSSASWRHLAQGRPPDRQVYLCLLFPMRAVRSLWSSIIRQVGEFTPAGTSFIRPSHEPRNGSSIIARPKTGQIWGGRGHTTEARIIRTSVQTAAGARRILQLPRLQIDFRFFNHYSMFGFPAAWAGPLGACADGPAGKRAFLMGRHGGQDKNPPLAGEGRLQTFRDGATGVVLSSTSNAGANLRSCLRLLRLAVIIQDGYRRMYQRRRICFYYTIYNEDYPCRKGHAFRTCQGGHFKGAFTKYKAGR